MSNSPRLLLCGAGWQRSSFILVLFLFVDLNKVTLETLDKSLHVSQLQLTDLWNGGLKWYHMGLLWGSNDTIHVKQPFSAVPVRGSINICCHHGSAQWWGTQALGPACLSLDPAFTTHWRCNLWQITQLPCSSVSLTVKWGKDYQRPCEVIVKIERRFRPLTAARHKVRIV